MKKIYEKNEMTFAILCIVVYCVLQSLANPLNERIGIEYSASALFCILQAVVLFCFIRKNGLMKRYGLCKAAFPARRFLYYIPLLILATRNLWHGAALNFSPAGLVCHTVCMLCVGFVEEIIFRGFLFKAIAKDSLRQAIVISSVTFGLGHILNLVNGSGMGFAENMFQIGFAVVIGFLFVILFHRGKSLLPCILTHSAINITSGFAGETAAAVRLRGVITLILFVMMAGYAFLLMKTLPEKNGASESV